MITISWEILPLLPTSSKHKIGVSVKKYKLFSLQEGLNDAKKRTFIQYIAVFATINAIYSVDLGDLDEIKKYFCPATDLLKYHPTLTIFSFQSLILNKGCICQT